MRQFKGLLIGVMMFTALAIAGCSSSGGGGGSADIDQPSMVMPVDGPTPEEVEQKALGMARDAAEVAYDAAKAALIAVDMNQAADPASHARAEDAVADAKAALDAANASMTSRDAENAQMDAEAAQANAMKYASMVTAAKIAKDAEVRAEEMRIATLADASRRNKAISDRPATNTDPGFAILHDGTLSIKKDADKKREYAATSIPSAGDFNGMVFTKDDGKGVVNKISVYTDIDAPTPTAFTEDSNNKYTLDADSEGAAGTEGNRTAHKLLKDTKDTDDRAVVFSSTANTEFTGDKKTIGGTLDGARGTYKCVAGVCEVGFDDGKVTGILDKEWIFIPSSGEKYNIADGDFMELGYWLTETTKRGKTTYEVKTFHTSTGSTLAAYANKVTDVKGKATYEGSSAGIYTHKMLNLDGSDQSASFGTFTADVELNARFGGPDVAVNDNFEIEGMISNFDLSGGESNKWEAKLEKSDISESNASIIGPGITNGGRKSGITNGGGKSGRWEGTFYGPSAGDAIPAAVMGAFDANFDNGSAAGAFGANKK